MSWSLTNSPITMGSMSVIGNRRNTLIHTFRKWKCEHYEIVVNVDFDFVRVGLGYGITKVRADKNGQVDGAVCEPAVQLREGADVAMKTQEDQTKMSSCLLLPIRFPPPSLI